MVTKFGFLGWTSLFGRVNLDLIANNYLGKNDYSYKNQSLIYPHRLFMVASKKILLNRNKDNKSFKAEHGLIISESGFLLSKLFVEIQNDDYETIFSDQFTEQSSVKNQELFNLQEYALFLSENFFGKSIIEFQFDFQLKSDYFKDLCKKYGVEPNVLAASLQFSNIVVTSEASAWEFFKKVEYKKTTDKSLMNSDLVILPNFENTLISKDPDIHIFQTASTILYTNERILDNTTDLIIGMLYKVYGLEFLRANFSVLQSRLQELRKYILNPESPNISWIYVNRVLTSYENLLNDFISIYEVNFLDYDDSYFINYQNINFKEDLEKLLEFTTKKKQYLLLKDNILLGIQSLRRRVLDKAEKEEKMVNERIVAVISFLAIFQVVIEILPILGTQINTAIRLVFLVLLVPTIIGIWYITIIARRRRIKKAEHLEHFTDLKRQRSFIQINITYLKEILNQKVMNIPDTYLLRELSLVQEKLVEIDEQIASYSKKGYKIS